MSTQTTIEISDNDYKFFLRCYEGVYPNSMVAETKSILASRCFYCAAQIADTFFDLLDSGGERKYHLVENYGGYEERYAYHIHRSKEGKWEFHYADYETGYIKSIALGD
jgi:hypothetical protein